MQTADNVTQAGGVLVVVGGMALVVLGIFQYLLSHIKSAEAQRNLTMDKLEAERLENAKLQGQLFVYEAKYGDMKSHAQRYYKLYKRYERLYEEAKPIVVVAEKVTLDNKQESV